VDCESRAICIEFENPSEDFSFYLEVLVPAIDAVIARHGLPRLTEEELTFIPEQIKASPVWNGESKGAILHRSLQDQTNCDHLGIHHHQ
jgi:hypothetical protein